VLLPFNGLTGTTSLVRYPGGTPKVNAAHPLAQGLRFAGIAAGANAINLTKGNAGTISGTVTGVVDGRIGPCNSFGTTASGIKYSGLGPAQAESIGTFSVIFYTTTPATEQYVICNSTNSGTGGSVELNSGIFSLQFSNNTRHFSGISPVANVPYYVLVSYNKNIPIANFVIVRLDNGSVQTATATNAMSMSAGDGGVTWGNRANLSNELLGGVAAGSYSSGVFMGIPEMVQIASAPWSLWYPLNNIPSLSAASPSSISATLSVTEDNDTLSSTASATISATLSVTEQNDSLTSTATSALSATLSVTEANDTLSSNTVSTVSATVSVTEANDTLSSNTVSTVSATLSVTESNDTLSSSGFSGNISCSLTVTEQNDSLSSTGTSGSSLVVGGRQRESIEWGWDWYNAPDPFLVSAIRTSAARLGQLGGIASGKARRR